MKDDPSALAETVVSSDAVATTADDTGLVGARLDHFVVEALLGRGGMGEVYSGTDTSLDRPVAIKVLRGETVQQAGMGERFLREARAQARFNHPNIVHIYYIGRRPTPGTDGALFFAMERIDGGDLDHILKEKRTMPPEEARQAMIHVARGLSAAHHAGVIHRDIKPSNLMVAPDGVIKIADFGLAKPLDGDNQITQEGSLVGSPYYIAPEQALGDDLDHRADMYAMGACFYHLLAGKPPFDGPRPMAVVAKHLSEPLVPLAKMNPGVPPALAQIVDRLLSKKPDERYEDYDALIDALEAAAPERRAYPPITTRAVAVLADFFVASVFVAALGFLDFGWVGLVLYLVTVTILHAWRGQSPGKLLFGLELRRDDGRPLGIARAALRTVISLWMPILAGAVVAVTSGIGELLLKIDSLGTPALGDMRGLLMATAISQGFLSLLYAGGLAIALFHPKRKTLHDLAVGSVVLYRLEPDAPKTGRKRAKGRAVRDTSRVTSSKPSSRPPPPDAA